MRSITEYLYEKSFANNPIMHIARTFSKSRFAII